MGVRDWEEGKMGKLVFQGFSCEDEKVREMNGGEGVVFSRV